MGAEAEFLKWLKKFCQPELKIVSEETKGERQKIIDLEGESLLKKIADDEIVCLLDLHGKQLSSEKFAEQLSLWKQKGKLVFVVGGAWGVSDKLRARADFCLQLSEMTFTHQMIRCFLMEQVFRAFSILSNTGYHK